MKMRMMLGVVVLLAAGCKTDDVVNIGDGQVAGVIPVAALAQAASLSGQPQIARGITTSEALLRGYTEQRAAAVPSFPITAIETNVFDSKGQEVFPPFTYRLTPTVGVVTGALVVAQPASSSPSPADLLSAASQLSTNLAALQFLLQNGTVTTNGK